MNINQKRISSDSCILREKRREHSDELSALNPEVLKALDMKECMLKVQDYSSYKGVSRGPRAICYRLSRKSKGRRRGDEDDIILRGKYCIKERREAGRKVRVDYYPTLSN